MQKENIPPVLFVSSLYDIYQNPEQVQFYIKQFDTLAKNPIAIILFCDKTYYEALPPYNNVIKIHKELNEFPIYKLFTIDSIKLPSKRNSKKDTKEFLALMNVKMDFLKEACSVSPNKYLCWIDAGIMKITKETQKVCQFISSINPSIEKGMVIPGCWEKGRSVPEDEVCWRFAGGFLLIHRESFTQIYQQIFQTINLYISKYQKSTWEVNIWALMEEKYPDNIYWFKADHNDSMFFIPREYLNIHLKVTSDNGTLYDVIKSFINAKSINNNSYIHVNYENEMSRYNQLFKEEIINPMNLYGTQEIFLMNRLCALKDEEIMKNTKNLLTFKPVNDISKFIDKYQTNQFFDFQYDKTLIHSNITQRIISIVNYMKLNINDTIKDFAQNIINRIQQPAIGIYIHELNTNTNNPYSRFEKEIIVKHLQEQLNNNLIKTIIIFCENSSDLPTFLPYCNSYPTLTPQNDKFTVLQNQLTRLLIFSQCQILIGKRSHNLTDLSFWFSQCSQTVVPIL